MTCAICRASASISCHRISVKGSQSSKMTYPHKSVANTNTCRLKTGQKELEMTWLRGKSAEFELMTVDAADGGLLRFSPYRAIELRQARRPNKQQQECHGKGQRQRQCIGDVSHRPGIHTYIHTYITCKLDPPQLQSALKLRDGGQRRCRARACALFLRQRGRRRPLHVFNASLLFVRQTR